METEQKRSSKKLLGLILVTLLFILGIVAWNNKWEIHDRWVSQSYKSTQDSAEVLNNLQLTSKGDLVYRASLTEVDDKDNFREKCPVQAYEQASVLGCYGNRKIYVLKVDEPKLNGVEEVTAAHELLHAKFERMDPSEKLKVGRLVKSLRSRTEDKETRDLVRNYESKLGPGEELNNEMFAIFGTQLKDVGSELEDIYSEYFKDRSAIVDYYLAYSSEFKRINSVIKEYDKKLSDLRDQKNNLEVEINLLSLQLDREKDSIDYLQNSDSQEEYQSAVEEYNSKVKIFNSKVEEIKSIIGEYNSIVEKRNTEALAAKGLADKLNANVEER
ncbi:MAG: hypothetical protein H6799_00505 [Candidatus Nomurabacteria bacterium]|nr:MAG: hypothetical protein H6799_00505 [Candidatus Nomurabacteria bacterium]HRV76219.1 hypothetical protein [Candidatus Saccharimonadales bacterium]